MKSRKSRPSRFVALGPGFIRWAGLLLISISGLNAAAPSTLNPPGAFQATPTSATSIRLNWRDTNTQEKNYLLEFRKGSAAFQRLARLPKNSTSYLHRNLSAGTAYTYRLSAIRNNQHSATRTARAVTRTLATPTPVPTPSPTPSPTPGTVATPTFDTMPGTYTDSVQVPISTATAGAAIRYTIDGSDPTAASTLYTAPLTVTTTTTFKARAFKAGSNDSAVSTATYTITVTPTVTPPSFNPAGGSFIDMVQVTISTVTAGATIRYTTNGNDPTAASTLYAGAITLNATTTLKARAFKSGFNDSSVTTATYTIAVDAPSFSPAPGAFNNSATVTISTVTPGAAIRYTTNGADPTADSLLYSAPLILNATTTLKARAFKTGLSDSAVTSGVYTITPTVATPTISPNGGTHSDSASVTLATATSVATIRYTTNGTTPTASSTLYTGAFPLTASSTVKAIAFKTGFNNSAVASAAFTIVPTVVTPVITPAAGTYTDAVSATITCATVGASIYYTTNGSTPTAASMLYTAAVPIGATATLKAIGIKAGANSSAVASTAYTIVSSSPRLSLAARAESTTGIRLNWLNTSLNQSNGLTLQRSSDGSESGYVNLANVAAGIATYLNTGLTAGQIYYYRARPQGTTGAWTYASAVALATNAANLPAPPTNLQVYPDAPLAGETPQVLVIQWKRNATNDTSYLIEKSDDGENFHIEADILLGDLGTPTGATADRFVDDSALPQNATYYYKIRAKNAAGISAPTDIVKATTRSTAAPTVPTGFAATAVASNTINLSWTNTSTFDGYDVWLALGNTNPASSAGTRDDATSGAASSVTLPVVSLTAGTLYSFKIRLYRYINNVKTYSNFTNVVTATTLAATGVTGVKFSSTNAYPIVSLKIDNLEQFPAAPQSIPPGTTATPSTFTKTLAAGVHTYTAQNGYWDGSSRFTLYSYSGSFTVTSGQVVTINPAFANPTIAQLMTQFRGPSGTCVWGGWYAGGTGFQTVYIRFNAIGSTCSVSQNRDGTGSLGSGTYAMQTNGYLGTFVANFNMVIGGVTYPGKLSETGGYFGATFPSLSPYAIQFNADGP